MINYILFAGIFFACLAAGAFTVAQMLRLSEKLEPRNQAVTPNEVNMRQ